MTHHCTGKLTGNAALDVLRAAIDDVAPDSKDRRELIRCFTERWVEALFAAAAEQAARSAGLPKLAMCPACFAEVTTEQADKNVRDSRRMDWLEQAYTHGGQGAKFWREFITLVSEVGFRDAIDRHLAP